jgi:hypothetical protein
MINPAMLCVLTATVCLHLQLIPVAGNDQNQKAQTLKKQGCNIEACFLQQWAT